MFPACQTLNIWSNFLLSGFEAFWLIAFQVEIQMKAARRFSEDRITFNTFTDIKPFSYLGSLFYRHWIGSSSHLRRSCSCSQMSKEQHAEWRKFLGRSNLCIVNHKHWKIVLCGKRRSLIIKLVFAHTVVRKEKSRPTTCKSVGFIFENATCNLLDKNQHFEEDLKLFYGFLKGLCGTSLLRLKPN